MEKEHTITEEQKQLLQQKKYRKITIRIFCVLMVSNSLWPIIALM